MWNPVVILVLCLCSFTYAVPLGLKKNMAIVQEEEEPMLTLAADEETRPEIMISRLNLPSNATSIRADISDGFSCDNKAYGYYADVENECQIFHVCLPVTYADGKENTFRWSFICPEETVFSQDSFTCMRPEDMSIDCEESVKYYELNRNFGVVETEDSLTSAEEELNFGETVRQPPIVDISEDNKQTIISTIVKKPIVKAQNSNRRKTQSNRISIESHRKKVQPLRKTPQPVVVQQTAKPVEEDAPIFVQEAERTTVKYQRFTKRPSTIMKEQPKPEAAKPEQQIVRQELFTQKRKRPQIYPATRLEAPVQIEVEPEAESALKSGIVLQAEPEPVQQAEAQASEIAEVSIKPQEEMIAEPMAMDAEKIVMLAVKNEEPVQVQVPQDIAQVILESEIAPMPENTPSRAEIIEIPIQKADEPLVVEEPAVVVPIPEQPMPIAELTEPLKAEEEIMANEEQLAEETVQSELSASEEEQEIEEILIKIADKWRNRAQAEQAKETEKVLLEPLNEPEQVLEGSEPEKLLETVKAGNVAAEPEIPSPEPAKTLLEPEMPVESPIAESKMPVEAELPAPEPEMPAIVESPAAEDDKPIANESPLRLEVAEPAPEPEVAMAEPEQPSEAEVPAEPEMLLKSEIPIAEPEKQLVEPQMPAADENPAPLLVELPTYTAEIPEKSEDEPVPKPEVPVEDNAEAEAKPEALEEPKVAEPELPEESKAAEPLVEPEVPEELKAAEALPVPEEPKAAEALPEPEEPKAAEIAPAPEEMAVEAEDAPEPIIEYSPTMSMEDEQPEPQFEKLSETQPEAEMGNALVQAEAQPEASAEEDQPQASAEEAQSQASAEENSPPPSSETDDAQTLILDFISSLVNSESSNLEGMKVNMDELPSESAPEPAIAAPQLPEDAPIESQADQEQSKPLYMPLMQGMDQGFQIPVQVIESPEPEPIMSELVVPAMPEAPAGDQPQQPLSIDDVVERVKESLDTPAEKEKLVQEPEESLSASQSESEEVKPIYNRYIQLGKDFYLTAQEEPMIIKVPNDDSMGQEEEKPAANADLMAQEEEKPADNALQMQPEAELPKASEPQPEPEQLASEPEPVINALPQVDNELPSEPASAEADRPSMSRSMNRFRMDPRKRRFLFRSDAS